MQSSAIFSNDPITQCYGMLTQIRSLLKNSDEHSLKKLFAVLSTLKTHTLSETYQLTFTTQRNEEKALLDFYMKEVLIQIFQSMADQLLSTTEKTADSIYAAIILSGLSQAMNVPSIKARFDTILKTLKELNPESIQPIKSQLPKRHGLFRQTSPISSTEINLVLQQILADLAQKLRPPIPSAPAPATPTLIFEDETQKIAAKYRGKQAANRPKSRQKHSLSPLLPFYKLSQHIKRTNMDTPDLNVPEKMASSTKVLRRI